MKTLNLPNNYKESLIAKYRCKFTEDEASNVGNWNEYFDKLKETHSKEMNSNEIDNLSKYAEKKATNGNR